MFRSHLSRIHAGQMTVNSKASDVISKSYLQRSNLILLVLPLWLKQLIVHWGELKATFIPLNA